MKIKKENGITLIALIITIIILVILAAVSIRAAYNSGIIDYSINGTKKYQEEGKKEESILSETEGFMASILNRIDKLENEDEEPGKDYEDNWMIAWVYDGENWSNPYSTEEGLIESIYGNVVMDSQHSINSADEVDRASLKALLYYEETSGLSLVISGTGAIVTPYIEDDNDYFTPWAGAYWSASGVEYSQTADFRSGLKNVYIRSGITSIGTMAFYDLRKSTN